MCGIAGILDRTGRGTSDGLIQAMVADLSHRGPDGEGVMRRGPVAFGHRRLSILDPAGGQQPMYNEDGEVWVTFNGEIYNFQELATRLESRGHRFRTRCDTEVLVHAWEEWGDKCVDMLRGMFAFAVMDWRRGTIFLARDHFGIKPLVWISTPEAFAFASEIAPLKRVPGFAPDIDLEAIDGYLWFQYITAPRTGFAQISKLPPAHSMLVELDGTVHAPRRYWEMRFAPEDGLTKEQWIERTDAAVEESVRAHLISDVPFGAFLSGGVDSSLVSAKMTSALGHPIQTFSIGSLDPQFDETPWARMASNTIGSRFHHQNVDIQALSLLPELVKHYGEPFADSSAIPTWHVSRLARSHVPMVLSGDGADEFFGGYWSYGGWMDGPGSRPGEHNIEDWLAQINYLPTSRRQTLWRKEFADRLCPSLPAIFNEQWGRGGESHPLHRVQRMDISTYLPFAILTKVDIASMMHGLEVRTPFVDVRLAEFAARIPARHSLVRGADGSWNRKRILKEVASRYFPKEMLERPKMGFSIPVSKWFQKGSPTWSIVAERLLGMDSPLHGLFRREGIQSILEHGEGVFVWQLLFLDEWLRQAKQIPDPIRTGFIETAPHPVRVVVPRPRILVVADVRNWIFERHALTLQSRLSDEFEIDVAYKGEPIEEDRYDLVYPLEWNLVPETSIRNPVKWVTGIRSHISWQALDLKAFGNYLRSHFSAVHVVSRRIESLLSDVHPRLPVMTHGIDVDHFHSDSQPSDRVGALRIGWAGNRASTAKGFGEFIEPLEKIPGVSLEFCGYSDRLLTFEEMRRFYEGIDVYVCSSATEGNNNSLLEAAAMGRAIVTTDSGTVPEYLEDGVSALIVPRNAEAFRDAIVRLLNDGELRRRLGAAAKSSVGRFSWDVKLEEHRSFFRSALRRSAEGSAEEALRLAESVQTHLRDKAFEKAIDALDEAILICPVEQAEGLVNARNQLRNVMPAAGRGVEVRKLLDQADQHWSQGAREEAIRTLQRAEDLEPKSIEIINAIAWAYVQMDRLTSAHTEFIKAVQIEPNNAASHSNLAGIRIRMGMSERAESELLRVLELAPGDADATVALERLRQSRDVELSGMRSAAAPANSDEPLSALDDNVPIQVRKTETPVTGLPGTLDHPGGVDPLSIAATPPALALPTTTVVIPVKDQLPLLTKCLDSILSTCGHHSLEILVVDDHSTEDTSRALSAWEQAGRIRLLQAPVAGNFAASCNAGARAARGGVLVFLNSDIEAKPGWLEALRNVVDETGVGAVGARLLYPDGRVQHAGLAFGPDGIPYHPNRGQDGESALVTGRTDMPGLTGACLAMRARVFSDLGGFDEAYRFQVEDLDLCLRIWQHGLRVVYEPAACLVHHEGGSSSVRPEKDRLFREGLSRLFSTWADKGGFPRLVQALPGFPAMLKPSVPLPTRPDASTPAASASSTTNFDTSSSASPKVSVVLPTRDRPVFLRRALESLRTQTLRDFEVVVVDDAGSDVSAIVASFANDDFPVRLEVHPERRGLGAARNTGIRSARAPWIAYLDDDDLYYPDHLRLLLETLERTGAKVAYSDSMRAVEEERNGEWIVLSNELAMSNDFDRDGFLRTNLTPVNNVIHARTCWEQVGCIDESLPVLEDWDFWIRLSRRWDFVHVPVATTEIRWRSNGANMTFQRQREFQPTRDRIAQKVAQMLRIEQLEREGVSIVILVRDCLEITRECLESLERHTPEVHEILLIDNGSSAETAAWLRDWVSTRPHAVLVRNDDNRGFAGGNNQGLALAKGRHVLLLNNDTVLTPGWLGRMLAVFDRHPECGAVGPVSNRISGPQLDATANYADTEGLLRHADERSRRFADHSEEILRAVGFCLLFRRDVFGAVGGLDERFGKGNFEDDDFSLRVRHAGWTSRMALDAFVHHVGGATFKGENIDYTKSLLTNWAIFLHKWGLPEDLPYEKGYPLQQSPPKLALSRIETPTPLMDHVLVEERVYLPSGKAVVPAAVASKPASGKLTISSLDKLAKSITMDPVKTKKSNDQDSKPRDSEDDLEEMGRMLLLAEASAARGGLAEADRITEDVVGKFPHQNMAWLARAMVLRGLGKFKKAADAIARAIQVRETPEALLEAMQIHLLADEAAPARKAEKALKERHAAWFKATREEFRAVGKPWPPDFTKSTKAQKAGPPARRVKK